MSSLFRPAPAILESLTSGPLDALRVCEFARKSRRQNPCTNRPFLRKSSMLLSARWADFEPGAILNIFPRTIIKHQRQRWRGKSPNGLKTHGMFQGCIHFHAHRDSECSIDSSVINELSHTWTQRKKKCQQDTIILPNGSTGPKQQVSADATRPELKIRDLARRAAMLKRMIKPSLAGLTEPSRRKYTTG